MDVSESEATHFFTCETCEQTEIYTYEDATKHIRDNQDHVVVHEERTFMALYNSEIWELRK